MSIRGRGVPTNTTKNEPPRILMDKKCFPINKIVGTKSGQNISMYLKGIMYVYFLILQSLIFLYFLQKRIVIYTSVETDGIEMYSRAMFICWSTPLAT